PFVSDLGDELVPASPRGTTGLGRPEFDDLLVRPGALEERRNDGERVGRPQRHRELTGPVRRGQQPEAIVDGGPGVIRRTTTPATCTGRADGKSQELIWVGVSMMVLPGEHGHVKKRGRETIRIQNRKRSTGKGADRRALCTTPAPSPYLPLSLFGDRLGS